MDGSGGVRDLTKPRADRYLFPLAAGWAMLAIPLWVTGLVDRPAAWHGHEMLFGFALAVIGGFLYTRPHGLWPRLLALAWLAGRLVVLPVVQPAAPWLGLAYPVLLCALLLPWLWRKAKRFENRIAPAVIFVLALLDAGWWLAWALGDAVLAFRVLSLTLDLLALLMLVMGGRALRAALGGHLERQGLPRRDRPDRENERRLALLLAGALALEGLGLAWPAALLLGLAGGLGLWRLRGWSLGVAVREVRLWPLALGYLWVPAGLLAKAAWLAGGLPGLVGIHALAVGALGSLTLVMMARTALLRAGQRLERLGDVGAGVMLVGLAALARLGADFPAAPRELLLRLAAFAWSAAFALLLVRLGRISRAGRLSRKS